MGDGAGWRKRDRVETGQELDKTGRGGERDEVSGFG